MRVTFHTTGVVDVDRQREPTVELLETLVERGDSLFVSTVTVAEIMTGANLSEDVEEATLAARRVLGQFNWIDLDGEVAETAGGMLAYLHAAGRSIEFQDVVIGASHLAIDGDALVTSNEKHLKRLPELEADVRTPEELIDEVA